jgi:hypothetical protein
MDLPTYNIKRIEATNLKFNNMKNKNIIYIYACGARSNDGNHCIFPSFHVVKIMRTLLKKACVSHVKKKKKKKKQIHA